MENNEELKENGIGFLKSLDISEISNRTFIHEEELKKFLSGDFEGINKTKAMGFIQIIQREYHIDLSDLKDKYISYLDEHKSDIKEPKASLIMEEVQSEERKKGFFSLLFLIIAIGAIAYLVDKYDLLNFTNPNDIKTAEVLNKEEVKDVKLNLEKLSQPQKPEIVKEQKKEEKVVASESTDTQAKEDTNTNEDLSLNNVLTPEKTVQESEDETANTQENSQNSDDLDLSKLNEDLATPTEENTDEQTKNLQTDTTDEDNTNTSNTEAVTHELYIIPNSKVWIGTIELDTLEKKDFLAPKGKKVDIDTSKNQLIMIGHKFIKIYLDGKLVHFKRRGPVRFKYIDGELTEINRREFNKLAKGRQW